MLLNFVTNVLGVLPWDAQNPDDQIQLSKWQSDCLLKIKDGRRRIKIKTEIFDVGLTANLFSFLGIWQLYRQFSEVENHPRCKTIVYVPAHYNVMNLMGLALQRIMC